MDSAYDHNYALQQNGYFTATDLEANKQGNYSLAQTQKIKDERIILNPAPQNMTIKVG